MRIRGPMVLSVVVVALMAAVSVWAWMHLPPGARIAVHWGLDGKPNGYASKGRALFLLPAMALVLSGVFAAIPYIEPRRKNLAASRTLYFAAWIGVLLVMAGTHLVSVASALGMAKNPSQWIVAMVAALLAVVGNYLGKSRSTFLVGLRLPWTLSSEYSWEKSSRIAGRALVGSGLLALLADAFFSVRIASAILLIGTLSGTLVAGVASYFYWLHDPNRQPDASSE